MRKHFLIYFLFLLAVFFTTGSCDVESPVFYIVSKDVKPVAPLIKGAPTSFAVYNNAVFVASGTKLWQYKEFPKEDTKKDYRWEEYPFKPEKKEEIDNRFPSDGTEKIMQIASTSAHLYALCYKDGDSRVETSLKQLKGSVWEKIKFSEENLSNGENSSIQQIFSALDMVFVGVRNDSSFSYTIQYVDKNDYTIKELKYPEEGIEKNVSGELSGAAYDGSGTYYICTRDNGIYKTASFPDANGTIRVSGSDKYAFTGIINLEDNNNTVVAISRGGALYTVNDSVTLAKSFPESRFSSTGAIALWSDTVKPDNEKKETWDDDYSRRLLLVGRQDSLEYTTNSGYTYGYLELELDENGIKSDANFVEPGINASFTTVDDNERFLSTIGKQPVNFIIQTPREIDPDKIIFASTQQDGVWSYRVRDKKSQWNAENGQHDDPPDDQ